MPLREDYEERKKQVEDYLIFLKGIERSTALPQVTPVQQKILYASAYLLLYNLIESTVTNCGKELDGTLSEISVAQLRNLTEAIRLHWLKHTSQYNKSEDKRLQGIQDLYDKLLDTTSLLEIKFDFDGTGNLDNKKIEEIMSKYGINTTMSRELETKIKKHVLDNMGTLQTIKHYRNALAHGEKSFAECGEHSVDKIQEIANTVFEYLEFIIGQIEDFIRDEKYLIGTNP
ncbi:MAG: hypothetical protein LBK82_15255 [Planctomycetaceae bacterium]|jgi:hypothetical protein|nr:hypothetical protein [Planctomycetaceae bacterium]